MGKKIKVGLLVDSLEIHLWQYRLLEIIIKSYYAEIDLVITNGNIRYREKIGTKLRRNWRYISFYVFSIIDERIFRVSPNAFELIDASILVGSAPQIEVKTTSTKTVERINNGDIEKISKYNLDVLIRFGFGILTGEILELPKYGVWSYHHGDSAVNRGAPSGFWEVMENIEETGSTLQIINEELDAGLVLYESYGQTDRRSVHRNRNSCYWKSVSFIPRKLEELYRVGGVKFLDEVKKKNQYRNFYSNKMYSVRSITNRKMMKLILAHIARYVRETVSEICYFNQWIILFRLDSSDSNSFWKFRKLIPKRERFYADPFIIFEKNNYYIYFEDFVLAKNKSHISMVKLDNEGNVSEPVKILERSYSLSYPFIFEVNGDHFMIPETRDNNTIDLYKCHRFPSDWIFVKNIMNDIEAVDTTIIFHQKKWWLFTNVVENIGASSLDELFLYHSDDLFADEWIRHPCNPIVSDFRRARSAGSIYMHNDELIRPSQNSRGRYGYGFKLNEIVRLNETEYEEKEVISIEPDWDDSLLATHTFNNVSNLTVIDAIMRRRRVFS